MLVNGVSASQIDCLDRGLQYGDGLFETLAANDGKPFMWEQHARRLREGCARLGIPMPDSNQLYREVLQESAPTGRCVIKVIVTRGAGGRGYAAPIAAKPNRIVIAFPWPDYRNDRHADGVTAGFCDTRLGANPALAGLKHLNRLEQVLARSECVTRDIDEGIMLDTHGRVVEGVMTNIFLVNGDQLSTPDLSECGIAGVVRSAAIELAPSFGFSVEVKHLMPHDVLQADAVFLTNSIIGYWPVRMLQARIYDVSAIPKAFLTRLKSRVLPN